MSCIYSRIEYQKGHISIVCGVNSPEAELLRDQNENCRVFGLVGNKYVSVHNVVLCLLTITGSGFSAQNPRWPPAQIIWTTTKRSLFFLQMAPWSQLLGITRYVLPIRDLWVPDVLSAEPSLLSGSGTIGATNNYRKRNMGPFILTGHCLSPF